MANATAEPKVLEGLPMTDITNSDDLIDVRDIIARVEEIEANRKPWTAGYNMPGYMPDSEPCVFEEFADACAYIAECLEQVADDAASGADSADDLVTAEAIGATIDEAKARVLAMADKPAAEYGETVGQYHYFITASHHDGLEPDELETFRALLEDLRGNGGDEQWNGDWYPVTLIRDSYFKDYAQELAEDIGAINSDASWPNNCIDWDKAARELQMDYSSVEFDGVTYHYR
jgi:hypothetical protein